MEGYSDELFGLSVHPSVCPSVCPTLGGVHCVTFAATPITAQLSFMHFLESQSDLDVHPRIRFSIFEKISSELASKSTLYGSVMLTKGSIALRLRANYSPYSNNLYIFGKPNRPRFASWEAFCSFWPKSSKLTSPK